MFRDKRDTLGGEDGIDADLGEEVLCASAECLAQILCGWKLCLYSVLELDETVLDLLFGEVVGETGCIDVSAASMNVDGTNEQIEKRKSSLHLFL